MNAFKWRYFKGEILLGCIRWYCKYGISYRDLEERMLERGVKVDHTTLYRWVQTYAPELEKRLRWRYKPTLGFQSLKTAYATLKGFEVMRIFKKGQLNIWMQEKNVMGEVRLINETFNIYSA